MGTVSESQEIIANLEKAILLNSSKLDSILARGLIHFCENRFKEALSDLGKCARQDKASDYIYLALANANFMLRNYTAAIKSLEQSVAIHNNPNSWFYLGMCHYQNGDYQDALDCFDSAQKKMTDDRDLLFMRGQVYIKLARFEEALKDFQHSFVSGNDKVHVLLYIASCLHKQKKYKQAIAISEQAIQTDSADSLPHLYRINAWYAIGNSTQILEDYQKFKEKGGLKSLGYSLFPLKPGWKYMPTNFRESIALSVDTNFKLYIYNEAEIDLFLALIHDFGLIASVLDNKSFLVWVFSLIKTKKLKSREELKLETLAEQLDLWTGNDSITIEIESWLQKNYISFFQKYPILKMKTTVNPELIRVISKIYLLQEIENYYVTQDLRSSIYEYQNYWIPEIMKKKAAKMNQQLMKQTLFVIIGMQLNSSLHSKYHALIEQHERDKWTAQIAERNRLLANLSHSIKNNISSIIDPLKLLQEKSETPMPSVENALQSTYLVSDIVNAMNYSVKGSLDDFYFDAGADADASAKTLNDIILSAFTTSINNMFDGRNFSHYSHAYFTSRHDFIASKALWNRINQSRDWVSIIDFLNKNMLSATIDIDQELAAQAIGDMKKSATKLLILFQEIILNAIKYSAPVDRAVRFIEITVSRQNGKISLKVTNRFKPEYQIKSSGLGKSVIENFAILLNTRPDVHISQDIYSLEILFDNFWLKVKK